MKTLVTHMSPDLDAAASAWLVVRYMPGWDKPQLEFVPTGKTLDGMEPDSNPDVIHVDTGFGRFDHHQTQGKLSATKLVFEHLSKHGLVKERDIEALRRVVDFVTLIDNFGEVNFDNPTSDVYDFAIHQLIGGMKARIQDGKELLAVSWTLLDAALQVLKNKIRAEQEISSGVQFTSRWGKTVAMETRNEEALRLALKQGYPVVLRKDPIRNYLKVKAYPSPANDLTPLYDALKTADPKASWFLHSSKYIVMNGFEGNPAVIPTSLTLEKVIEIIKEM